MHLAWRWFTGLGFDPEIPYPSTFSKNRDGRFQESKLFEQLFEQIAPVCGSRMAASWGERWRRKSDSTGRVGGGATGPSHRASVSAGTGTAEPGGRTSA
jgi:hypothetical protein